ncbi:hypothetical protein EJ02DRAFT_124331 [Clathrospora elynae]|uniref:Uncharacterized protein n=1 Tax=Clathrospora elynae TaxID=706981 RepID=A0A6A5S494_9PLEO|nr:hypothetical protein EJ02DRAFT_124331 [Clathrospora elynae]
MHRTKQYYFFQFGCTELVVCEGGENGQGMRTGMATFAHSYEDDDRTPTFQSCRKVKIHRFFYLFYLKTPFLISPQRYFYAAALWAGAQTALLQLELRIIFSGLCIIEIRTFGQGNSNTTSRRRAALEPSPAQTSNKAASLA